MSAKVYSFPTQDDRDLVHLYVNAYARDTISRQEMMNWVTGILDSCGVSKLNLDGYRVRKIGTFTTQRGTFPVVLIEATKTAADGRCPVCGCGACQGRYMAGEAPVVTFFCNECGTIYEALVGQEGGGSLETPS